MARMCEKTGAKAICSLEQTVFVLLNDKSRMKGDFQVRFREKFEVKVLLLTRLRGSRQSLHIDLSVMKKGESRLSTRLEVAGGLKFGSSQDEIREAYGEPDYYYEGDEGSFDSLSYDNGSYDYETKFYVYDDKGITDIKLENDVKKPSINIDYDIDESLIAYEEPEYDEEEKPKRQNKKKLSNDWLDMEFSMDGEIYTMPEYFGFLAEDGWEIKDSEYGDGYVLNPGEMTFGTIDITNKDYDKDLLFWVGFANTSDRVKDISECSIYSLKVDIWFLQDEPLEDVPELVVANGITWGSTAEDIMDAFGEPDYEQNEDGYVFYSYYGDHGETLSFCVYDEYGVTKIEYELQ